MNRRHPLPLVLVAALGITAAGDELLVTSRFTNQVLRFDAGGNPLGPFAGAPLLAPVGATFGPDGALYVTGGDSNQLLKYDATGAFLKTLDSGPALNGPRHLNFGPDGLLYVASGGGDRVLRYTADGVALGAFATAPGLDGPTGLTFGPDGHLYVGSVLNNRVLRFHGQTGAFLGVFATTGLNGPHDLAFGPDGHLYVTNAFGAQKVVKLDGATGAFLGVFVTDPALQFPLGLTFGVDGLLYVANQGKDEVRRYFGTTGGLRDVFVTAGAGGLDGPGFLAAPPAGALVVRPPSPPGTGKEVVFAAEGAHPGGLVGIFAGIAPGSLAVPSCPGVTLDVTPPILLGHGAADEGGRLVRRLFVPAAAQGLTVRLQAVDASGCQASPVRIHTF